ncbi:MAG: hypothetical protein JXA49_08585, partial [Actinobacteria bacterium]|nr:hypothetical protein [Actinomycetota bacterium]
YVQNEYSVSTKVTADESIIAERAMYWGNRMGGHDSIGVTSPSTLWYLAEGSTANGFETWILLQNPGETDATAQITYMTPEGEIAGPGVLLPANSRMSISVAEAAPDKPSISTMIIADKPINAERAMYWGNRIDGHDSIGSSL